MVGNYLGIGSYQGSPKKKSFLLGARNKYSTSTLILKNECFVGVFFVFVKTPGVHGEWIGLLADFSCNGFIAKAAPCRSEVGDFATSPENP